MSNKEERTVLPSKYGGGPQGLGDPSDNSLRKVEKEVMIPKKMRDLAQKEKCINEVKLFTECCKENSVMMVFKCRSENTVLKDCLTRWYQDEEFKERCTKEYLFERSEYRRTGVPQSHKQRLPTSM